jgi:hypothetical protein
MNTAELQQQAMEPAGEASGSQRDHGPPAAGHGKPQAQQASSSNHGQSTAEATALQAKVVGTTALSSPATTAGNPVIRLRSRASCETSHHLTPASRHRETPWRKLHRHLGKACKATSRLALM